MKLFFDLRMTDEYGNTHAVIRYELPEEAAYMGPRIAGDVRFGLVGSFEDAVEILRVKELRRDLLARAGEQAGYQMADFLQDREGWHGADRQEAREAAITAVR